MTVTFGDGLLERLRKSFTSKRPTSPHEFSAVVLLHGPEDGDEVNVSAELFTGEGFLWLLAEEFGGAKFGRRYPKTGRYRRL